LLEYGHSIGLALSYQNYFPDEGIMIRSVAFKGLLVYLPLFIFVSSLLHGTEGIPADFSKTVKRLGLALTPNTIIVSVPSQTLTLYKNNRVLASYKISTSEYGVGCLENTQKTPLGLHRIAEKIGAKAPAGTIFYSRENSGRKCKPNEKKYLQEDLVLTRILWLDGLEVGVNKGRDNEGRCIDSHDRYIYIHATNNEKKLGTPASHGCVRMSSKDVIDLFDKAPSGTLVWIE